MLPRSIKAEESLTTRSIITIKTVKTALRKPTLRQSSLFPKLHPRRARRRADRLIRTDVKITETETAKRIIRTTVPSRKRIP